MKLTKKWWGFWKKEIPKKTVVNDLKSHDDEKHLSVFESTIHMNIKKRTVEEKSIFNEIKPELVKKRNEKDLIASRPPKEFERHMYSGMTSITGRTSMDYMSKSFGMSPGFNDTSNQQPRYFENNGAWVRINDPNSHFLIERNKYTNEIRTKNFR